MRHRQTAFELFNYYLSEKRMSESCWFGRDDNLHIFTVIKSTKVHCKFRGFLACACGSSFIIKVVTSKFRLLYIIRVF